VDVGHATVSGRHVLQHHRQARRLALDRCVLTHHFVGDLDQLVKATAHHAQIILHHAFALDTELLAQLVFDRLEESLLIQASALHQGRSSKKGSLESVTLHAELQFGAGCLLAGDTEPIDEIHLDLVLGDEALRMLGDEFPDFFRLGLIRLDDKHPAIFQAKQRIRMGENVRVGRHHDVDVGVLAVEPDRLGRR